MANTIHIGCQQLQGEIHWQGTCPTSKKTQGTLQTQMQLDRNTIHWDNTGLGGMTQNTWCIVYTKLHEESIGTIPTHHWQTTARTVLSVPIQYGVKKKHTMQESNAPLLDNKAKRFIQQVCGNFLFLGRAVDSTLLCLINAIAFQSSKPTKYMMRQTLQLLDHLAMQEDAVLSYHASDMVLAVHSSSSYLREPKARSRAGGHFFLSSDTTIPPNNGAVLNIVHIIKNIMSLVTEGIVQARVAHNVSPLKRRYDESD
jgi:hypothetical protein